MAFIDKVTSLSKILYDVAYRALREHGTNEGLTEKNLIAFLEAKGIQEFLSYRSYEEIDGVGVYHMSDDRKALMFRVFPPAFLAPRIEDQMQNFFDMNTIPGTTMHFYMQSSQNIDNQIDAFVKSHPCESNVRNQAALRDTIDRRAKSLKKWTRSSMASEGVDIRLRSLVNVVCVTYPNDVEEKYVREQYDALASSLGSSMPAVNFEADDFITLIREVLHNDKDSSEWNDRLDTYKDMSSQLVAGGIKIQTQHPDFKNGLVFNDANYVAVLSTKQYPRSIELDDFKSMFFDMYGKEVIVPISGPFFASLSIIVDEIETIKSETLSKLRHDLKELNKLPHKRLQTHPDLKDRRSEVRAQIAEIIDGESPMRAKWTLVLYDTDKRKLKKSISNIKTRFSQNDWKLVEESFGNIALLNLIYSLPGLYNVEIDHHIRRYDTIFKSNCASILPFISDFTSGNSYHMPFTGRSGQLLWFDPYDSDTNQNIAALGYTGSGKSFTVSDMAVLTLAKNGVVRIIDSLPSYVRTAKSYGGDYYDFSESNRVCVNFFTKILTKKDPETGNPVYKDMGGGRKQEIISDDDLATIVPIIGMMCHLKIASNGATDSKDINTDTMLIYLSSRFEEAVIASFDSRGRNAGMRDVYAYLSEVHAKEISDNNDDHVKYLHSILVALESYSVKGRKGYDYYNGINNIDLNNDFVVFELQRLEAKGVMYPLVMMTISNMIVNEFFTRIDVSKILFVDEFWKFKSNKIVLSFFVELARKVRKAQGLIMPITQKLEDYSENDEVAAIYDSCAWKLMLSQPSSSIDSAMQSKKLSLTKFFARLLKSIEKRRYFGELALLSENNFSILRLKTDAIQRWMYTTDPKDIRILTKETLNLKGDEVMACRYLGYKEENPTVSSEEALYAIGYLERDEKERLEQEKIARRGYVIKKINEMISLKSPVLLGQNIYNREKEAVSQEITCHVFGDGNENIAPAEWMPLAHEEGLLADIDLLVFKQSLAKFASSTKAINLNISKDLLLDNKKVMDLKVILNDKSNELSVVIEVPLRNFNDEEIKKAVVSLKTLRMAGVFISNDNLNINNDFKSIIEVPLDYIKIDGFTTSNLVNEKSAKSLVEIIIILSKHIKAEVCFNHIDDEKIYNMAHELGGDFFQGYYLSNRMEL